MDDYLIKRFATYYSPGEPAECWPFLGTKNSHGYGTFRCGKTNRGAHVVSWEIANGRSVAKGLMIRHSCDNRQCVNPAHLAEGTHADNMRDRNERGRQARGAKVTANRDPDYNRGDRNFFRRHPERIRRGSESNRALLTEETAREAILCIRAGVSQKAVADALGVSRQTISVLWNRGTWKHVWAAMEPATIPQD